MTQLKDDLTSEERLIVLTSRLSFSDEDEQKLARLVKGKLDWLQLFRIALKNKVVPLVWNNLQIRQYGEAMQYPLWQVFHFCSLGTKERNSVFMKELEQVALAMNSSDIPCIPVKGAYLIPELYKDPRIRTMNDIDCLVERSDVSRVRSTMNSLGYVEGNFDPLQTRSNRLASNQIDKCCDLGYVCNYGISWGENT